VIGFAKGGVSTFWHALCFNPVNKLKLVAMIDLNRQYKILRNRAKNFMTAGNISDYITTLDKISKVQLDLIRSAS